MRTSDIGSEVVDKVIATVVDRGGANGAAAAVASVILHPLPWWQALLVRAARAGLMAVTGVGGVDTLFGGNVIGDLGGVKRVALKYLFVFSGAAVSSLIVNGAELLAKIDQTNPAQRA